MNEKLQEVKLIQEKLQNSFNLTDLLDSWFTSLDFSSLEASYKDNLVKAIFEFMGSTTSSNNLIEEKNLDQLAENNFLELKQIESLRN